ncbi:type II restriction endonuclease [Massilia sp. P8910]|uniref:type II restriction endonuclease n=1 Tax=Massilia antarctica TaxID=2765360 RepID=UPI001E3CAE36|nr:type II restriction endonuclease [Massilia antarctica]MCE3602830.1 type II restriction endonuclease [Massilia antarctica]
MERWRGDAAGTYQSWFLWEERLKNFRSIRRGLQVVVQEIRNNTFGTCYRGSSLETVVHSIAEQRQIFKGADHAFLWKPKLRIPDIYENRDHQLAFGRFLDTCLCCDTEAELVQAVRDLESKNIKGVGPASANLLYFLHPTILPPTNTAIIKGYNLLTGAAVKLGRWPEYLAMRQGMMELNRRYRTLLSNDLGALAGLLFDIGSGRYPIATPGDTSNWKLALAQVCAENAAAAKARMTAANNDHTHTEIQGWLRDLGLALGYDVWIASNDKNRPYLGSRLSEGCLARLPDAVANASAADTIALIDVLWISQAAGNIAAAFEVEHSTSIYSGIVRMLDLALGVPEHGDAAFFLVAPDTREQDVRAQFARPAFSRVSELNVRYLGYSELKEHKESIARFGSGLKGVAAISASLRS